MRPLTTALIPALFSSAAFSQERPPQPGGAGVGDDSERARAEQAEEAGEAGLPFPRLSYGVAVELADDFVADTEDGDAEINDLNGTVEGLFALEFAEDSGVFSTLVFEELLDQEEDSAFDDHGAYVEEFFAAWRFDHATVRGGKFNPVFGVAWGAAPGLYGADFAEDYELTERIGAGASFDFAALGGEHALSAAVFFADTTALGGSVFTERGELSRSDGGPSNTESPESVALELSGAFGDTGYALGLERQEGGRGDSGDELGLSLAVTHVMELGGDVSAEVLGEVAHFDDFGAGTVNATYVTLGGAVARGPFVLSAVYAHRDFGTNDHLATTTLEYQPFENASIGVGYRFGDEEGVKSHTVGVLFAYEFGGGVSLGR